MKISPKTNSQNLSPQAKITLLIISLYQKINKLFPGQTCRFTPTCSEYTRLAIKKYGVWQGLILGIKRISRCHPWNPGGYDPLK